MTEQTERHRKWAREIARSLYEKIGVGGIASIDFKSDCDVMLLENWLEALAPIIAAKLAELEGDAPKDLEEAVRKAITSPRCFTCGPINWSQVGDEGVCECCGTRGVSFETIMSHKLLPAILAAVQQWLTVHRAAYKERDDARDAALRELVALVEGFRYDAKDDGMFYGDLEEHCFCSTLGPEDGLCSCCYVIHVLAGISGDLCSKALTQAKQALKGDDDEK